MQTVREQAGKSGTGRARHVLIKPDPRKKITIYGIETGTGSGGRGSDGADHITFSHFVMPNDGSHECTISLRPDTYDVTLDHVSVCSFYMDIVHGVTVRNSRFGPCSSGSSVCDNSRIEGGDVANGIPANSNIVLDHNVFHDYLRSSENQHFECLIVWSDTTGLTLSRNKFTGCAVFDALLESDGGSLSNILVENNWFDLPTDVGTSYAPGGQPAIKLTGSSCYHDVLFRNNSLTNNTKVLLGSSCSNYVNTREIGDVSGQFDCQGSVTYAYNVGGESCRGTGNRRASLSGLYQVNNYLLRGGNLHLRSKKTAAARRVPIALCPAVDIDGNKRTGRYCDAGSDER
jgi:hypothetical protein